jgi:hypothetical protein
MKYETPELTALMPAINAVQSITTPKSHMTLGDPVEVRDEAEGAYADWE